MSACIYHDAEAVAVCSGCDFGVCQQCMDDGTEGVCSTCAEEREMRRQHSALQREYTVEEQVARCNYCRAAADEETPLDHHGYCPTCTTLARCCVHEDLIAVGHCKSCRKEYCRKCLGFTDICQVCTAKNKSKPAKPVGPPASRPGVKKTAPPGKEAARKDGKKGPPEPAVAGKRKPGSTSSLETTPAAKKKGAGGKDLGPAGKGKKGAPSRGQQAMEERIKAKNGSSKWQVVGASAFGMILILGALSGMFMRAASPMDQAKQMRGKMVAVHKSVVTYYRKTGKYPSRQEDLRGGGLADASLKVTFLNANAHAPQIPNLVIFKKNGGGFVIMGENAQGELIKEPNGSVITFDQYFDSSAPE